MPTFCPLSAACSPLTGDRFDEDGPVIHRFVGARPWVRVPSQTGGVDDLLELAREAAAAPVVDSYDAERLQLIIIALCERIENGP